MANGANAKLNFDGSRREAGPIKVSGKVAAQASCDNSLRDFAAFAGYPRSIAAGSREFENAGIYKSRHLVLEDSFQWCQFQPVVEFRKFGLHLPPLIGLGGRTKTRDLFREGRPNGREIRTWRQIAKSVGNLVV
jgi:hypothetical protein